MGNNDGVIKIYNIEKSKCPSILFGHLARVSSLDWCGSCLASGSRDGFIRIWDLRTNSVEFAYKAHQQEISGLKWSIDGSLIASGGNDNKLVIHDNRINVELAKFS